MTDLQIRVLQRIASDPQAVGALKALFAFDYKDAVKAAVGISNDNAQVGALLRAFEEAESLVERKFTELEQYKLSEEGDEFPTTGR